MKNWGKHFGLVEIRKRNSQEAWDNARDHTLISGEVAIRTEQFSALPPWEKATARAAAVGLTVDTAVVAGKSAARLWGIEVLGWDQVVELMHVDGKQAQARSSWQPGVHYRYCHLSRAEIREEHGLRVTDLARTLRDIARYHGLMDGLVAVDSVRKKWPEWTKHALHEELTRGRPYPGIRTVRQVIEWSIPNSGSALESRARFLLLVEQLPQVESIQAQVRFSYEGGYFEVDLLINGWLIIEVDGEIKYDGHTFGKKTDEVVRDERGREKYLQNLGKVVLRVSHRDLLPPPDGGPCRLIRLVVNAFENYAAPVRTSRSA